MTIEEIEASKIDPTGFRVLVELQEVKHTAHYAGKSGTVNYDTGELVTESGFSLKLPEAELKELREREEFGNTYAKVLKISELAWSWTKDGVPWACEGDIVLLARYAGDVIYTKDNQKTRLRIINDEDIKSVYYDTDGGTNR